MEDRITLSLTEVIACEVALDEVLEDLRASAQRRKEGLGAREAALEQMLRATRRSIGAKRSAAERGDSRIPGGVDLAGGKDEVGAVRILSRRDTSPDVYDVGLEPGATFGPRLKPDEEPLDGEGGAR